MVFIFPKMKYSVLVLSILSLIACQNQPAKLPILGPREAVQKTVNGQMITDTLYHQIPAFRFQDQRGAWVTEATFQKKIYVADFFFTSCPTICPKMKTQMLRVYERFRAHPSVSFLSHSIDSEYDTIEVLQAYGQRLGIDGQQWHLVTGDRAQIYEIGQKSYMVTAREDETAEGGLLHDGSFLLIDTQRRVRGRYDGTQPEAVDRLMDDMLRLLEEEGLTQK
jgi:protein SCO1